jgi:hypothetical protein
MVLGAGGGMAECLGTYPEPEFPKVRGLFPV